MMAATTSFTIMSGVHEKTIREGILSWQEPHDQPNSWSLEGKEAVTRVEMDFSGQKTKLGSFYNWGMAPAVQLPSSLPDYFTVRWTVRIPVAQAAIGHIESWNFDLRCFTEGVVNVFGIVGVLGFFLFSCNFKWSVKTTKQSTENQSQNIYRRWESGPESFWLRH